MKPERSGNIQVAFRNLNVLQTFPDSFRNQTLISVRVMNLAAILFSATVDEAEVAVDQKRIRLGFMNIAASSASATVVEKRIRGS
jgi:hypothetical protein